MVDDIGLEDTKELPPSSQRQAAVHRTAAFRWVRVHRPPIRKDHPGGKVKVDDIGLE